MIAEYALRWIHRTVWQRLPQHLRRDALVRTSGWFATKPAPDVPAQAPIIVAGTLRTASGLGQSARLCYEALEAGGLKPYGVDLTAELMQPRNFTSFTFRDGGAQKGAGTLLLHVNSPLVPLAVLRMGKKLTAGKRIIGCWNWELPQSPGEWQHGVPFVHEIWVPSSFTAKAIMPMARGRPLEVLPPPVASQSLPRQSERRPKDHSFNILTIFDAASSVARKNPCAVVRAFRKAFSDDPTTRLVMKVSSSSIVPGVRELIMHAAGSATNIEVIEKTLDASELAALYDEADVLISLHRSEGFGLVMAEAMLRGLAVVGTNWSSNVDFLNEDTGLPIGYDLVPAQDPQGTYHFPNMMWAEPNVDEAAEALRRLRSDVGLRTRLGQSASAFAARAWSTEVYVGSVCRYLERSGTHGWSSA